MQLCVFRTIPLSIIRSFSLYTQQWYMSYSLVDSFLAGSGWKCRSILILLESYRQNCMTYTIVMCTVNISWWWTEELSETCRFAFQNKLEKLTNLVGFIIRWLIFVVCELLCNHFGAKISSEHEYNCSKTSLKNTIANEAADMPSAFMHF
jgi:hypothetical protein